MPGKNSQESGGDERLKPYERLLLEADDGHLDRLVCPRCCHEAVSVWFTHPAADEYRTWFICADCDFYSRAHNAGKPRFFSEGRCRMDLEERDAAILQEAIFKRPAQ